MIVGGEDIVGGGQAEDVIGARRLADIAGGPPDHERKLHLYLYLLCPLGQHDLDAVTDQGGGRLQVQNWCLQAEEPWRVVRDVIYLVEADRDDLARHH